MKAMVDSMAVPRISSTTLKAKRTNSFIKGASVFARNWPYQWGMIASEGTITQDVVDVDSAARRLHGWRLAARHHKNSVNKEGAWYFMKYVATQGQKIMSVQGGYLPAITRCSRSGSHCRERHALDDRLPECAGHDDFASRFGALLRNLRRDYERRARLPLREMELSAAVEAINAALAN